MLNELKLERIHSEYVKYGSWKKNWKKRKEMLFEVKLK